MRNLVTFTTLALFLVTGCGSEDMTMLDPSSGGSDETTASGSDGVRAGTTDNTAGDGTTSTGTPGSNGSPSASDDSDDATSSSDSDDAAASASGSDDLLAGVEVSQASRTTTSNAEWDIDPCATPDNPPAGYRLVRGTDRDDVIDLSDDPGKQMIIGGKGNDTIYAGPGDDIVCAGPGRDRVFGQEGDDYIDGGYANDELYGNNGHDIIHGRGGSDTIYGGGGWDVLFGDILDDHLFGGRGRDLLIGGHGVDFMHGGPGSDWLRGDTNGDQFVGGKGFDIASFMTTTPPGQYGFRSNPPEGIDLKRRLSRDEDCEGRSPFDLKKDINYRSCAWGDGRDGMMGIEVIVGSPFDDVMAGAPGIDRFYGGYGNDTFRNVEDKDVVVGGPGLDHCDGVACDEPGEAPVTYPLVYVDARPRDLGIVFLGGDGDDAISVTRSGRELVFTEFGGRPLAAGAFCRHPDAAQPNVVKCATPHKLRYLLAWGGDGNDTILLDTEFPRDFTAHIDGGPGDDHLRGGPGEDVILAGATGNDQLYGNAGDDALITESTDGDFLSAGRGNDQLVANYPCAGHTYHGGPGQDIAGFARVGFKYRIRAQLGGPVENPTDFHGYAYSPGTCGADEDSWTVLLPGLEILEGGGLADELYGDDTPNIIWGRDGDDEIRGYGGNDILWGGKDNDKIYGGAGRDIMKGFQGFDLLYAQDGEADLIIDCGEGGRLESADPNDPNARNCN